MRKKPLNVDYQSMVKPKHSLNQKKTNLNMSSSLDSKLGITRIKDNTSFTAPDHKIKSNSSFMLESLVSSAKQQKLKNSPKLKQEIKLPSLKVREIANPQRTQQKPKHKKDIFYQTKVFKALTSKQNTYMLNLARPHFMQSIQALRIGKNMKLPTRKEVHLSKKNPKFKTVFLDLDQTLIHCDEMSNNYTVRLDFPIENGSIIQAGIRVRPHCQQFLQELAQFAQVIIFTASSSSYADVVLNYLDPKKKIFAHRLYREHCALEKGFYTKDLKFINRRMEDSVLVDNSAFSFMTNPDNAIPILPYYQYAKDKELVGLLKFLKLVLAGDDVRKIIRETFFWHKYMQNDVDPRKIMVDNYDSL